MAVRERLLDGAFVTGLAQAPDWSMPWLPPTGRVTGAALAVLDRPLLAWEEDDFDAHEYYAQFPANENSALERRIAELGERPAWRMERLWIPDEETSEAEHAAYDAQCRDVAGVMLAPRCLDAYVQQAYDVAGLSGVADDDVEIAEEDLDEALEWAAAGVCVLQLSLPWPFMDFLLYGQIDNRPAHRILCAYARLLARRHPRAAHPWWRAMVYLNPPDNLGARFFVPGGRR